MIVTEAQQRFKAEVAKRVKEIAEKFHDSIDNAWTNSVYPWDIHREIAAQGWTALLIPPAYKGAGKGAVEATIVVEELAKAGVPFFAVQIAAQASRLFPAFGTEAQKGHYLPRVASGEYVFASAISEPQAGSSLKQLSTSARREGNFYIINGKKTHINVAQEAHVMYVFARTERGLTVLLVDKINQKTPGMEFRKLDPMVFRDAPVYEVTFQDCRTPADHLLGEEGKGLDVFITVFNLNRIINASQCIGLARLALELAVNYGRRRLVGDKHVTDFQGIQWMIADLYTKLEAARLLRDKAALMEDQGVEHSLETSVAKLFACEVAEEIISKSTRMCGGYAYYRNQPFWRLLQEVKMPQMGGGSLEIMRNIIFSQLIKSAPPDSRLSI